MTDGWSFETRQIHAGQTPDPTTGARALPIYQTTSYVFRDAEHAANLFALKELGNIYTRIMNPTTDAVEQRIASLEGGVGALLVASGQAAETLAILNVAEAGDHIVSSPSLYGGTYNLFHYTLPKLGIEVTFVEDPDDPDSWRAAVRPNTKAFFGETISNPKQRRPRHRGRRRGRARGRRAADRRQHRGHAVPDPAARVGRRHRGALGHQVPRRPRHRDRRRDRRRRHLRLRPATPSGSRTTTSPTPATTAWSTPATSARTGPSASNLAFILKARVQLLRDLGPAISPFNAFLIAQGIETLSPAHRAARANAQAVAEWLEARDEVDCVAYAGPAVQPVARARPQVRPAGAGRGARVRDQGRGRGRQGFVDALELHSPRGEHRRRPQPGHPPGVDHAQPAHREQEQLTTGVTPGLVRLAVGIEHIDDILADLEAGFRAAKVD